MSTITEALIGRKATSKGGKGVIRYLGETEFAEGVWVGLELTSPTGICCRLYANLSIHITQNKMQSFLYIRPTLIFQQLNKKQAGQQASKQTNK